MDFRATQRSAIRRSLLLLTAFAVAVAGVVVVVYPVLLAGVAIIFLWAEVPLSTLDLAPIIHLKVLLWCSGVVAFILLVTSISRIVTLRREGGAGIARRLGGRRVMRGDGHEQAQLLNVVEEMAIASGMPVPRVYAIPDQYGINAFAAGYSVDDAVIGVTAGFLFHLTRDEMQGVIAHEFSHILHGDMNLNLHLLGWLHGVHAIGVVGQELVEYADLFDRLSAVLVVLGGALVIVGYGGHSAARLVKRAFGRQREYLADASAVEFTRNPGGLAGALKKVGGTPRRGKVDAPRVTELSHLFFADALTLQRESSSWHATHPPLIDRILRLDSSFSGSFPVLSAEPDRPAVRSADSSQSAAVRGSFIPWIASIEPLRPPSLGPLVDHLRAAVLLLDAMPGDLRQFLSSPRGAAAFVCALLLDKDEAVRARQREGVVVDGLDDAVALAADVPLAARLPLIDLAIPSLKQLSAGERVHLQRTLTHLATEDGHESVLEYTLQAILAPTLSPDVSQVIPLSERRFSLLGLEREISIVLSRVAHCGAGDARAAFLRGVTFVTFRGAVLEFLAADACGMDVFRRAVMSLRQLGLGWRRKIIDSALAIIHTDDAIRPEEAELHRALSTVLDCPVPLPIPGPGGGPTSPTP